MGVPAESVSRDVLFQNSVTEMKEYGSHNVSKGTWSDDTSMTLATIDAIISTGTIDYSVIACTGGLAGIIYGEEQMNDDWKKSLLCYNYIKELCNFFDETVKNISQPDIK